MRSSAWHNANKIRNTEIRARLGIKNIVQETEECKSDWVKHVEGMENARLPQQGVNYKPTGRRIGGIHKEKENGGTKFIFSDRNRLNSINIWRVRKRINHSFLPTNYFSVVSVVILTHSSVQDKIFFTSTIGMWRARACWSYSRRTISSALVYSVIFTFSPDRPVTYKLNSLP